MKKENIYKLVEKGYIGGQEYNNFVSEFINNLNNEKYFEMADYIKELQLKNSKVSLSNVNTDNNEFTNRKNKFIFPKKLEEKTFLLQKGLKQNLIKNVLLIGRPGTGKTSYVEYMKNLLNLPLINVKFSDILDYKYGESIKKLENFMNEYRYIKCIIFFDEADSLFRKRNTQNNIFLHNFLYIHLVNNLLLFLHLLNLTNILLCQVFFHNNLNLLPFFHAPYVIITPFVITLGSLYLINAIKTFKFVNGNTRTISF